MIIHIGLVFCWFCAIVGSTFAPTVSPTNGLVLFLPFNGDDVDYSDHGQAISVFGATRIVDRFGAINQAYHFNIYNFIRIPNSAIQLNLGTGNFSVSAWVKATATSNIKRIFSHGTNSASCTDPGFTLSVLSDNTVAFNYHCSTGGTCTQGSGLTTTSLTPDLWYLITVSVNRGISSIIYINGVLDTKFLMPATCDVSNSAGYYQIGAFDSIGTEQFLGDIDDVRVYNRAITASEARSLYFVDQPSGLIAHFSFNNNATDSSGHSHTTSVYGATPSPNRFGVANTAYHFTTNSYIDVMRSKLLDMGPGDFTISTWLRLSGTVTSNQRIFSQGCLGCHSLGYLLMIKSGNLPSFYMQCAPTSTCVSSSGTSTTALVINQWYLITLTVQRNVAAIIYINGVIDTTFSAPPQCDVTNTIDGHFMIGSYNSVGGEQFLGDLDDLRVCNTVLTSTEVLSLYFIDQPVVGLVLHLPFTNNIVADITNYHTSSLTQSGLSPVPDRYGVANNAYHFVTNSLISIPIDTLLNIGPGDFSLSAWVRINSNTGLMRVISHGVRDCDQNGYTLSISNAKVYFIFQCAPATICFTTFGYSTQILAVNLWYLITVTIQRGVGAVIYINGVQDSTLAAPLCDISNPNFPVVLGAYDSAGFQQFLGDLDDIRIYNTALTTSDVLALYSVDQPANRLVAYFPFNGDALDVSGYGLTTAVNGAVQTSDRFGVSNRAYHFTASTSIIMSPSHLLQIGPNDVSLSAWVKLSSLPTASARVISHGAFGCTNFGYTLFITSTGKVFVSVVCQSTCGAIVGPSTTILAVGLWYLVSVTVTRGGAATIYINGYLDSITPSAPTCDITNTMGASYTIGSYNATDNVQRQFLGDIDEVRIYNTALTASQVQVLYFAEHPNGPVVYLNFNQQASDVSNFGHPTTLNGGAVPSPDRFGVAAQAYEFFAASTISVAVDTFMQIGRGDFTLSAWFKRSTTTSNMRIMSHGAETCPGGYGYTLVVMASNQVRLLYMCGGACGSATGSIIGTSLGTVAAGSWGLVTVTVQRGVAGTIYINGLFDSTFSAPVCDISNPTSPFVIAAYDTAGSNYQFIGNLDEIRVYNTVLTPTQVLALYFIDQPVGLILRLSFDDGTVADSSGYNHLTTITGIAAATGDRFGATYKACNFVSGDALTVSGDTSLQIGPGDFSISVWVRMSAPVTTEPFRVFSHGVGVGICSEKGYALMINGNNQVGIVYRCGASNVCADTTFTSVTSLIVNAWTLVTATVRRGVSISIYINGVLDTSSTQPAGTCDVTNPVGSPFVVGAYASGGDEQFLGDLDDLRVYNTVLTSTEVLALYSVDQPITGLIAYFPFSGDTVDVVEGLVGAPVGAVVYATDRNGFANSACTFSDLGGSIQLSVSQLLAIGPSDFTLSAWVRPLMATSNMRVLSHGAAGCNSPGYAVYLTSTNRVAWTYHCTSSSCGAEGSTSTGSVVVGSWSLITVTIQRKSYASIYINGMLDSSMTVTLCDISNFNEAFRIGAYDDSASDQFVGDIDEVRVYNTAISASAVRALYYDQTPSSQPSRQPSNRPTVQPSRQPSSHPSTQPSGRPSRQPSQQPTLQPTSQPLSRPTSQPSRQPSLRPTDQPSRQPSVRPSSQPSTPPSTQPSCQPSSRPTWQPSEQPTSHPSGQPMLSPSSQPSEQPTLIPSVLPSATPSRQPFGQPSVIPSKQPDSSPSCQPSLQPNIKPSCQPSRRPSNRPSNQPTSRPSRQPSAFPSQQPFERPSTQPSRKPSEQPSVNPTLQPTSIPSNRPNMQPSDAPSVQPSTTPSLVPSIQPSHRPSTQPSVRPSEQPSGLPSKQPSEQPAMQPSCQPSAVPSSQPTGVPSSQPSWSPSVQPTKLPTVRPSLIQSNQPTSQPTAEPTGHPSTKPSTQPSSGPSNRPILRPSEQPQSGPSAQPSSRPSGQPSAHPANQLSSQPSGRPSSQPRGMPSGQPSTHPSSQPSRDPSTQPTDKPSAQPLREPSMKATELPSSLPSGKPSYQPSMQPSDRPSLQPSGLPSSQPNPNPSRRPFTLPSMQPVPSPTFTPTERPTSVINFGTFPSNRSISVRDFGNNYMKLGSDFKIVLPFFFADVGALNSFSDVLWNSSESYHALSYVMFGNIIVNKVLLSSLLPSQGFVLSSAISYDFSGRSVSNAGDVNGDGYEDLIIGVPGASLCYVLFGTLRGWVNMTEGFTVFGGDGDNTGWSVSGAAGDLNDDNIADIIIGAPGVKNGAGAVYVLFGKLRGFTNIHTGQISALDGCEIHGDSIGDHLGLSVSGAGDVNGDGFDDIIMGALKTTNLYSGAAYVVYGNATLPMQIKLNTLGARGIALNGANWAWCGYSVSGAGDVNNDSYADIIIGCAPRKGSQVSAQQVSYVVHGASQLTGGLIVTVTATQFTGGGVLVSGLGDINGDGFDDVLIGSGGDYSRGAGYIVRYPLPTRTITPSQTPMAITPSSQPSLKPSNPTFTPTFRPSQPTLQPTCIPSSPTCSPSTMPTVTPTVYPSTTKPSIVPTISPSNRPTTTAPTSRRPSGRPTFMLTGVPTRIPVVRPSTAPSTPPTTIDVVIVIVDKPGLYVRNITHHSVYIINSTGNVTVSLRQKGGGAGKVTSGGVKFIVYPNAHSDLIIDSFNVTSDVIDLTAFTDVHSTSDFEFMTVQHDQRRPVQFNVRIVLRSNQVIQFVNMTSALDVNDIQFIFYSNQSTGGDNSSTSASYGPLIVGSVLAGSLILYILYRGGSLYREHKLANKSKNNVDWDAVSRDNPTYVSFNSQDSWMSHDSNSNSSSSVDSDSSSISNVTINSSVEHRHNSTQSSDESKSYVEEEEEEEEEDLSTTSYDGSVFMDQLLDNWHCSDSDSGGGGSDIDK